MWFYGFIKTKVYQPSISQEWYDVAQLQGEVAFGVVLSPWVYVASFLGVSLLCGLILWGFNKRSNER